MESQITKTHQDNYYFIHQMLYKKHGDDFIHVIDVPDRIETLELAIEWYEKKAIPEVPLMRILDDIININGYMSIKAAETLKSTDAIQSYARNGGVHITLEQACLISTTGLEWMKQFEADYASNEADAKESEQAATNRLKNIAASKLTYKNIETKPMLELCSDSERLAALLNTLLETTVSQENKEGCTLLTWATELANQQAKELKAHGEYMEARKLHDRELESMLITHGRQDASSDIPF